MGSLLGGSKPIFSVRPRRVPEITDCAIKDEPIPSHIAKPTRIRIFGKDRGEPARRPTQLDRAACAAAAFIIFVSAVLAAGSVLAQQRLPMIPPDQYTADQKRAAEEFLAARKVPVFGPLKRSGQPTSAIALSNASFWSGPE